MGINRIEKSYIRWEVAESKGRVQDNTISAMLIDYKDIWESSNIQGSQVPPGILFNVT
jgi:hypothetical protein